MASGLRVTATSAQATVTVLPGIALDSNGRHISLAAGGNAEIGQNADDPNSPPDLVGVSAGGAVMPTTGQTGDKYVTIQFHETFDTDAYINNNIYRYNHTPWIRLLDAAKVTAGISIILAKVSLDALGNVTNLTQEGRQGTDLPTQSMHLKRSVQTAPAPNFAVDAVASGTISARTTGGIDLSVPNGTDEFTW